MTTTIVPMANSGPGEDEGLVFPRSAGMGMGGEAVTRLREAGPKFPKPKVEAKKFIKAAEGVKTPSKAGSKKVKKGKKPENLRVAESKNKKRGAFGEVYKAAPGGTGKGVRVAGKD